MLQNVDFWIIEDAGNYICYKLWEAPPVGLHWEKTRPGPCHFLIPKACVTLRTTVSNDNMSEIEPAMNTEQIEQQSFLGKLLAGKYGLAITYWALYFIGAGMFFVFGSRAVDAEQWIPYLAIVAVMMTYTVILIIGVRAAYKGPQLWKVMSRTSSVFMIINILVGISTLGFVY